MGIISGRSLSKIKAMVGIEGIYYAGNHRLEIEGPGLKLISPAAEAARGEIKDLTKQFSVKLDSIEGVIDEDRRLHGKIINGYPILGGFDWLKEHNNSNLGCICAIGTCETRKQVVEKLVEIGVKFHNAIHPSVIMSEFVELGHELDHRGGE